MKKKKKPPPFQGGSHAGSLIPIRRLINFSDTPNLFNVHNELKARHRKEKTSCSFKADSPCRISTYRRRNRRRRRRRRWRRRRGRRCDHRFLVWDRRRRRGEILCVRVCLKRGNRSTKKQINSLTANVTLQRGREKNKIKRENKTHLLGASFQKKEMQT